MCCGEGLAILVAVKRLLAILIVLLPLVGCRAATTTEVTVYDFRNASGAYVLVYSTDQQMRAQFEDRLVSELAARNMKAFPSHPDLHDVKATDREALLGAAKAQHAMFVLVIEEVEHSETGVVASPKRITHDHPDLQDFYQHTHPADHEHADQTQLFVEVSAFLIQGDFAKLVWSGATWSVPSDGDDDRIAGFSTTIADAIEQARREFLGHDA